MTEINFNPIDLTQALVRCKSITPKDDGALMVVEKHLKSIGFECNVLKFSEDGSYDVDNFRIGPGRVQNIEVRNSQNRWYHENRGEISCRMVVSRGRGLVSLTIS